MNTEILKDFEVQDLIKELQFRGYNTNLLWCRDDVVRHFNDINESRGNQEKFPPLEDGEMDEILDDLSYDWYCEKINEEIYNNLQNYLDVYPS